MGLFLCQGVPVGDLLLTLRYFKDIGKATKTSRQCSVDRKELGKFFEDLILKSDKTLGCMAG